MAKGYFDSWLAVISFILAMNAEACSVDMNKMGTESHLLHAFHRDQVKKACRIESIDRSRVLPTESSLKSSGITPGPKSLSVAKCLKYVGNMYSLRSMKPKPLRIKPFIIAECVSLHSRVFGIASSMTSEIPNSSKIPATNPKWSIDSVDSFMQVPSFPSAIRKPFQDKNVSDTKAYLRDVGISN